MGRVSKNEAAKNRHAVVTAASILIRGKGLSGVGVRELMSSAGLTPGAFSKQFGTKEALAAEACAFAFAGAEQAFIDAARGDENERARRLAGYYLAPKAPEHECPMATLALDAARSAEDSAFRQAYSDGLDRLTRVVAGDPPSSAGLALLAAMIGASILSKATLDKALADKIEAAVIELTQTIV